MDESNIQLTINLNDPGLDAYQRDDMTERLKNEMPELDGVKNVKFVEEPNPPEGALAAPAFVPGMIAALVTPKNIVGVVRYLINLFCQEQYIDVEANFNGVSVKLKVKTLQDLEEAISSLQRMGLVREVA